MNRWLVLFCLINIFTATARKTDEAFRVLQRVSKQSSVPVKLELKKGVGNMYYEYSVKDGILHLKGSDNVSLCRGFYDYVKTHRLGMYTWSGNNIRLPEELPAASSVRVESPFRNHYYFNVCTYG